MYTTLISATTLTEALTTETPPRLLDCRGRLDDPSFGERAWQQGHLPGALYLSLDHDLAAPAGDGGRHPLPDPERLAERLRALGINDSDQVVVYDDAGGAFAARAWWCLRWLGHAAVAVLDGGIQAWAGERDQTRLDPSRGNFSIRPGLTRTIDAASLCAHLDTFDLIDARTQARFDALEEPIDPVAGHIPGATCRPFQGNLGPDGYFLDAATLASRFARLKTDQVVCYCGSGITAAHNVLAMRIAGMPEPLLYPGSWSEWIRDPARPRAP